MRTATAKGYQDARDYLHGLDLDVELQGTEDQAWRFKVTQRGHTTQVMVPFAPTDADLRRVGQQLSMYFRVMP